jgi:Mn-dependent DtxR family transcriptional regulator
MKKRQAEILECFKQMNLRDSQINKIVQKMKQMLVRVEKGESEIKKIEGKLRVSVKEARDYLKKLKTRKLREKTRSFSQQEAETAYLRIPIINDLKKN